MAQQGNKKTALGYSSLKSSMSGKKEQIVVLLRLVSLFATLSATIVMALNKETRTIVVATIGTTSIKASLTAKFQHTPANIFFVVANGLAALHNILALAANIVGRKLDRKGVSCLTISILDIINLVILSAAASSAAFMAEVAKHGNSHAGWNKICDKFETFCSHGAGALLASFIGLTVLLIITLISMIRFHQIENNKSDSVVEI